MKAHFFLYSMSTYLNPKLNLNLISTKFQLNLISTSTDPQAQIILSLNPNFNLNLLWLLHESNPILVHENK